MTKNLENELNDIEHNTSDIFIPLKPIRHISKIMKIKDLKSRCYELGIGAWIIATQASVYYNLYDFFKGKAFF